MKCIKCGFVSFDYLSECKKCGTSLAGAREALGLGVAKPVMPSYLGSLLKDYVKPAAHEETGTTENSFSSFDFGEEFESPKYLDENAPAAVAGVADAPPEGHEDFNLLDISDEEMDLLIAEGETEKTAEPTQAASELSLEMESGPKKDSGGLIPKIDLSSLPGLSGGNEPAGKVEPPQASAKEPLQDEGLQIELSEKDLESLLSELENSSPKKEKKDPGPKPETEPEKPE